MALNMDGAAGRTVGSGVGRYRGRFAPSPTGALHAGSMVAALASWLDARANSGCWLVRIEDVDTPRCQPGAEAEILRQLGACGLLPDEAPVRQSERGELYAAALQRLIETGLAYGCRCTRREIAAAQAAAGQSRTRHAELVYPGSCRPAHWLLPHAAPAGVAAGAPADVAPEPATPPATVAAGDPAAPPLAAARAWRLLTHHPDGADVVIDWSDRALGAQQQNVSRAVGDFVLKRADGLWAYQLAVVVDDAAQGITDVVRGADLADNTPRQLWLQRCLGLPTPRYLHTPLVLGANGEKLSKQNGAAAVDVSAPREVLWRAAAALGLAGALPAAPPATLAEAQAQLVAAWRAIWLDTA